MAKRLAAACTLAVLALMLAAVPAGAADGIQITISLTATLTNRVAVSVPVQIACPTDAGFPEENSLVLLQAVGRSIAHGTGAIAGLVCDGTPHDYTVGALADPSGPPFKKGRAVVQMTLRLCDFYNPCMTGYAGPQSITLR